MGDKVGVVPRTSLLALIWSTPTNRREQSASPMPRGPADLDRRGASERADRVRTAARSTAIRNGPAVRRGRPLGPAS